MNFNIIICVSIIFQGLLVITKSQDAKCGKKAIKEMDKSISKLMVIGQRNAKYPTNAQQLRPYCNLAIKTLDRINEYSDKCLPKVGRDTAKVVLHPIGAEVKSVCKPGKLSKKAKELLTAAECANAGLKNWERCMNVMIEKLTGLLNAKEKQRIPMVCCNFHQFMKCLGDEAEEVKACTRKTFDFVYNYIYKVVGPGILLMCSEYSEPSDKCDRLVNITPNRTSTQPKYKTVLLPIIDLTLSLGDG